MAVYKRINTVPGFNSRKETVGIKVIEFALGQEN
jgi:hypothetical protein